MIRFIVAVGAFTSFCCTGAAGAQISIPFFKKLTSQEVCLAFNKYCQPTSSLKYHVVKGADMRNLDEWLATTYSNTVFERNRCPLVIAQQDFEKPVINKFSATIDNKYKVQLRSKLEIDVLQYISSLGAAVPDNLKVRLAADATDQLLSGTDGKAKFIYSRHDLKFDSISKLFQECSKTRPNAKFVTGVSVVTMSGDWARQRIIDSFGKFEASADFIGLTPDIKSDYQELRRRASAGTFDEFSFVIATAWRKTPNIR